jgi:hypothetical protein
MEMHLRNLRLLYRLLLSKPRDTVVARDFADHWSGDVKMVTKTVPSLLFPALAKLLAPSGAASRTLIPHHRNMPDARAAGRMLGVMLGHDRLAVSPEQQQQQEQQQLYDVGSTERAQWLRAAEAAALTLHLMSQTEEVSRCALLLPGKGRQCLAQPC